MMPVTFQSIEDAALLRHGSAALAKRLLQPKAAAALAAIPDDRWLSTMTRRIFQAGLKHDLVDKKWPAFEEVFDGFDPRHVAGLHDEDLEAMLGDVRLIRHMGKLQATRHNAQAAVAIAGAHGSFGRWVADWPATDITGLWGELAKRMKQLGGNSAPVFLRMMGKDTFVPTDSVLRALAHWDAFDGSLKNRADAARLQAVFNFWHQETGKPLCQLSQILAMSVD
jgi:3-methyladenine DNA glycosylase Tag